MSYTDCITAPSLYKVKKTAKAVFLEKVFLMGYLIKLQNVLGRLRDYNSSSFIFRKYQGFTKLTNSSCRFYAFSTNKVPTTQLTPFFNSFMLQITLRTPRVQSFLFPIKAVRSFPKYPYFQEAYLLPLRSIRLRCASLLYRFHR